MVDVSESARPRAQRLPAEERRRQIIEVAMRVFARAGYAQAGTAEIAAEAGISEPTIYRHFESKQALYLATLDAGTTMILTEWRKIVDEAPDPLTAISRISIWYEKKVGEDPTLLQQRFRSLNASEEPAIRDAVRDAYLSVVELVRGVFERAIELGMLPKGLDPNVPTVLFLALGALSDVVEHLGMREDLGGESYASAGATLLAMMGGKALTE